MQGFDGIRRSWANDIDVAGQRAGLLTTTTQYIGGNQTRVTNPRGQVTISRFQAFDTPEYSSVTAIQHPEGAFTDIVRNVFGKPTTIRRRNADGSQGVTRSYVYDAQQQLCKSIEPETGATAFGYDAAGNLAWSASGLALPSASSCDADAAYASGGAPIAVLTRAIA